MRPWWCLCLAMSARSLALPKGRLIVGYATSRSLREDSVVRAVEQGVNVVIFAFAHLEVDGEGLPYVAPTFDVEAVREARARATKVAGRDGVAFLCAFGGWNGPHPSTRLGGGAWYDCWKAWNEAQGGLFDGVDWDLEGHDDPEAATATMDAALVDLVADFSARAAEDGFAVFLAPAESHLDAASSAFNLSLRNEPLARWDAATTKGFPEEGFPYAGRNAYAAIVRRAGVEVFALISIQLYEGYSRACHATTREGTALDDYLVRTAEALAAGFAVDFDDGPRPIVIPPEPASARRSIVVCPNTPGSHVGPSASPSASRTPGRTGRNSCGPTRPTSPAPSGGSAARAPSRAASCSGSSTRRARTATRRPFSRATSPPPSGTAVTSKGSLLHT